MQRLEEMRRLRRPPLHKVEGRPVAHQLVVVVVVVAETLVRHGLEEVDQTVVAVGSPSPWSLPPPSFPHLREAFGDLRTAVSASVDRPKPDSRNRRRPVAEPAAVPVGIVVPQADVAPLASSSFPVAVALPATDQTGPGFRIPDRSLAVVRSNLGSHSTHCCKAAAGTRAAGDIPVAVAEVVGPAAVGSRPCAAEGVGVVVVVVAIPSMAVASPSAQLMLRPPLPGCTFAPVVANPMDEERSSLGSGDCDDQIVEEEEDSWPVVDVSIRHQQQKKILQTSCEWSPSTTTVPPLFSQISSVPVPFPISCLNSFLGSFFRH